MAEIARVEGFAARRHARALARGAAALQLRLQVLDLVLLERDLHVDRQSVSHHKFSGCPLPCGADFSSAIVHRARCAQTATEAAKDKAA